MSQELVQEQVVATPTDLLATAVAKGASTEQMQQLMQMKLDWEANEARKAFAASMARFRSEAPNLEKQAKVDFTSPKGRTHYQYSSLDYIMSKVNPILAKNGLTVSWQTDQASGVTVHCDVMHELGHSTRVSLSAEPDQSGNKNSIQAVGSTVTYLQRYTLLSALGLATGGQDNDVQLPIGEQDAQRIRDFVEDNGIDEGRFSEWLTAQRIASVSEIPESMLGAVWKALNKSAGAKDANS